MKKFLYLIAALAFFSTPALAVKVNSLYQVQVPVPTMAADTKEQAVTDGFAQVLFKLSGNPDIEKNPVIQAGLRKADYYVKDFSYSSPTTSSSEYYIQISYEPSDVNRLLKKAGIASWGETRPLILVWLAVTNKQNDAEIIDSESSSTVFNAAQKQAKKYSLPLIFPIMDMTDMGLVSPVSIQTDAVPALTGAAKRYFPDGILIGDITENDAGALSKWQLIMGNDEWRWSFNAATSEEAMAAVIDGVSQALTKHYVANRQPAANSQLWLKLQISNIRQENDINQIMQYLKQLPAVQHVMVSQVSGNVVEFAVLVRGDMKQFTQNASNGQHLVLKSQDDIENKLVYEWVR